MQVIRFSVWLVLQRYAIIPLVVTPGCIQDPEPAEGPVIPDLPPVIPDLIGDLPHPLSRKTPCFRDNPRF